MTTLKHYAPGTYSYQVTGWGERTYDGQAVVDTNTGKAYSVCYPEAVSGVRPTTLIMEGPGSKSLERAVLDQLPAGAAISPIGHSSYHWTACKAEDFQGGFARLGEAGVVFNR